MQAILQKISQGESLSEKEMKLTAARLFTEEITESEIAALLISLRMKGETVAEISGLAKVLREKSLPFDKQFPNVMDNCGTGGDGSSSFNISTTSAFVVAGAGIPVAKHGNRSVSSKTGSADVLEHLGIKLDITPEKTEAILAEVGITFLYAPYVHPKLHRIMKVRNELKVPTIFNLIGPLTNPVELETQLLGIYRRDYLRLFAEVLQRLGRKRAVVVNGAGYMDEASLAGENYLAILENGTIKETTVHPEEIGLRVYPNEAIRGGNAEENARILLDVLHGKKGPYRDTVLFNAGIALFTAGKAKSINEGIQLARESLDSKAALNKLEQLISVSKLLKEKVM